MGGPVGQRPGRPSGRQQERRRRVSPISRRESACKPGSVESNHSSGARVAAGLERPTRKRARIDAAPARGAASLFGLAPGGVCRAAGVTTAAVRSYRTVSPLPATARESGDLGGLLSVALSVGSRPPGVTWHLIRRSPDFPPPSPACAGESSDCSADSRTHDSWPAGCPQWPQDGRSPVTSPGRRAAERARKPRYDARPRAGRRSRRPWQAAAPRAAIPERAAAARCHLPSRGARPARRG